MRKNNSKILRSFFITLVICTTLVFAVSCAHTGNSRKTSGEDILTLWTEGSSVGSPKEKLIAYVESVTKEGSESFIPVQDRIAVFDFDGTLFCETDPNYFDYTLLVYRVTIDEDYKNKASAFEREVAEKIIKQNETGASFKGLEIDHGRAIASAFKGMTPDEFYDYVARFKQTEMPSYTGMKRGEGFYKPMLQIIDYLVANDFTVYIVSGTDRLIVRGIFKDNILDIPFNRIIGSDETLVATSQGNKNGLDYQFTGKDTLVTGGDFIIKNLKMNKVSVIYREIGKQPVLSFGNSTGDSSMANYTITGNKYPALAFMLCCDDTVRENGNIKKADTMYDLCKENGWIPVSMKNDWTSIYGDGVSYNGGNK